MYTKSSHLYDKLYHFKDYEVAAAQLREEISHLHPEAKSLLDVACSTGRHAAYLKEHFEVEGLDLNPDLVEIARERSPELRFHEADMTQFDLGRTFDVVTCLFSSIAYARNLENLGRAISCMAAHVNPGGLLFVEPWVSPEKIWTDRVILNVVDDDPAEKITWMYMPRVENGEVIHDIHFQVGTLEGVQHFQERHHMGLFRREDYEAVFAAESLEIVRHDDKGFFGNGLHVVRKPS